MKTIPITIISIIALALSGCATGYYQRGYAGYNRGYSSPSYYQSYGRSYYGPGASFSYGREYLPPSYGYGHREHEQRHDRHQDWNSRSQYHGGWNDGRGGGIYREAMPSGQHTEHSQQWGGDIRTQQHHPRQMQEQHGIGFGGGHEGGHRHHDRHAE